MAMSRAWRALARGRRPPAVQVDDEVGQALVRRWRRGDEAAFAEIFDHYRGLVFGVLSHVLAGDNELEDVVQTTFVEIFRALPTFEGRSKLSSWIAGISLHVGYHHLRRRRSRPHDYDADFVVPDEIDETLRADPGRQVEAADVMRRVYAILATLAPKKRTVFILNDLQGLPQEEVAEVIGTRLGTVRTRLFYARREFWKKARKDPLLAELAPPPDGES